MIEAAKKIKASKRERAPWFQNQMARPTPYAGQEAGRAHMTTAHRDNQIAASAQDTRGATATSTDTGSAEASTATAATESGGDASNTTHARTGRREDVSFTSLCQYPALSRNLPRHCRHFLAFGSIAYVEMVRDQHGEFGGKAYPLVRKMKG